MSHNVLYKNIRFTDDVYKIEVLKTAIFEEFGHFVEVKLHYTN